MKSLNDLIHHEILDHLPPMVLRGSTARDNGEKRSSGTGSVVSGAAMAVVFYVLYSVAMAVLARHVYSAHTFGDFSAAVAAITVGATAGTLGLEKYLLKIIPSYRIRGEMDLLRGFRRFAPGAVFLVSLGVAGILFVIYSLSQANSALHHSSFLMGICFLPIVVLASYFLEVVTADSAYLTATVIYRLIFPGLFLGGIFILDVIHSPIVAEHAVAMWGMCWAVVLVLLLITLIKIVPRSERKGTRVFKSLDWVRHSSAYLTYSLLLSVMANTGILILGFASEDKKQTAIYAVAAQLGAVFVVISTAMNRWYGPQISEIFTTHDADRAQALIRSRKRIMWSIAFIYAACLVFLGKPVLALFGPEYVAGYVALLIIGAGTIVTSVNSIAPIYIQYSGKEWIVPIMLGVGVGLTIALSIPMAALWGVEGAAIGYSVSGAGLFMAFHVYARHVRKKRLKKIGRTDLYPRI